jgi:hypothetical protein
VAVRGGHRRRGRDRRRGWMELRRRQAELLAELDQQDVGIEPEESLGVGHEVGQAFVEVLQQGVAGELAGFVLALVFVPDAAFDAARQPVAATPDGDGLRVRRDLRLVGFRAGRPGLGRRSGARARRARAWPAASGSGAGRGGRTF